MKKVSLSLILIIFLAIISLISVGRIKSKSTFWLSDIHFWRLSNLQEELIFKNQTVGQTFKSNFDNLGRIDVLISADPQHHGRGRPVHVLCRESGVDADYGGHGAGLYRGIIAHGRTIGNVDRGAGTVAGGTDFLPWYAHSRHPLG